MTELLYLQDSEAFETSAEVRSSGIDERGNFVILDRTIFYPQGGGQPADHGFITGTDIRLKINDVRMIDDDVRHYFAVQPVENQSVCIEIDRSRRKINSNYHTAGHLLSAITEELYPILKAMKGHHFPGEAYVEFQGEAEADSQVISEALTSAIQNNFIVQTMNVTKLDSPEMFENLPYEIPSDKKLRGCKIAHYKSVPCGGTHVKSLAEIGSIVITRIKSKKGSTKVSYTVG